ncbi:MAG: PqqD family protein [Devosia sp.]
MELTDRFVPRSEDVASEGFDGEFVVLDLKSGKYFSLIGGAGVVWRGLMSGHSIKTLCAQLAPADSRRADVARLIETLVGHGLIVVASGPAPVPPHDVTVELAGASGTFTIETFDDLADFMLADPIHDVDPDTGWPTMPTKQD